MSELALIERLEKAAKECAEMKVSLIKDENKRVSNCWVGNLGYALQDAADELSRPTTRVT